MYVYTFNLIFFSQDGMRLFPHQYQSQTIHHKFQASHLLMPFLISLKYLIVPQMFSSGTKDFKCCSSHGSHYNAMLTRFLQSGRPNVF